MLTPLSILSLDQGKLWREPAPAPAPAAARPPRPLELAAALLRLVRTAPPPTLPASLTPGQRAAPGA
jgi:hypothetical protein